MKRDRSNAGAKLSIPEPREGTEGTLLALQSTAAGTWEIRPLTSEHRLSPQSRELLGTGRYEPGVAASGYAFFEGMRAVRVFGTPHPIE
jgi:hypothetical protein